MVHEFVANFRAFAGNQAHESSVDEDFVWKILDHFDESLEQNFLGIVNPCGLSHNFGFQHVDMSVDHLALFITNANQHELDPIDIGNKFR